ncbi:unnamed protein product [Rotaria sp. Silwood1]|nr:unnamed protein product [Rotaria sp. Silwood1]CAF4791574.1 unnamed protein product [Rotaria sp. Silwood1]
MQGRWKTKRSNNEFVRTLHSLPCLRSLVLNVSTVVLLFDQHWPQIIDLNIRNNCIVSPKSLSSIEIDGLCRSFTHLKRLAFDCENVRNLSKLFNNMTTTLSNIHIRHYTNLRDNNLRLITRQWLEQNTKLSNFDYFNGNDCCVYLWL